MVQRIKLNSSLQGLRQSLLINQARSDELPNTGTSTYNGYVGFSKRGSGDDTSYIDSPEIVGNMAMTAYFGTNDVTGSMWNFIDAEGHQGGGSIQLIGTQGHKGPGPSGASGEAASYVDSTVNANGSGMLDWGERKQKLDVQLSGGIRAKNAGLTGYVSITSTVDGVESQMLGKIALQNDGVKTP
ncbi:hypothetical protein [Pseudorhodobacter sp.]|uniref:hypothetical protein n=1 Tax=Pseudorhodobacter sp. TaxID=1934400 RepID=UPI00264A152D|nr:hypothetical protein [Pseudorhodobacter sp.]MDN5785624.1 hypothetical protein [Pseudorhodobacter sp.]